MLLLSLRARSVLRAFACWRRHAPAVQLALAVMVGQAFVWGLDQLWLGIVVAALLAGSRWCAVRGFAWLVGGLIVGIVGAYLAVVETPPDSQLSGELTVRGTVTGSPRHPKPGEVTFELTTGAELGSQRIRCRAIDLPWRNAAYLEPGDVIWVRGTFSAVTKPLNPFSWEGWLWRRGVRAECKARFVSRPVVRNPPVLFRWREATKNRVIAALGDSHGTGLFLSMALGYHDLLSVPLEKAFTRLGLTHLLVVSGYQVSLTFGFVLVSASALVGWLRYGGRYLRSGVTVAAFAFAALYVLFIGAEMSAVRALLAAACVCAHLLSERETSFAQRWGVALLGMQILWPWCAFDIGVVLTFAALIGIGLGSEVVAHARGTACIAVTIAVWLCTSLVIVVWQGTISPMGLVLNLVLAAPWSILNCTVGLSALVILHTGIPGSEYPLRVLVWLNQTIGAWVLELGEVRYASWQTEGPVRVVVSLAVAAAIVLLVRRCTALKRVSLS